MLMNYYKYIVHTSSLGMYYIGHSNTSLLVLAETLPGPEQQNHHITPMTSCKRTFFIKPGIKFCEKASKSKKILASWRLIFYLPERRKIVLRDFSYISYILQPIKYKISC